MLKILDCTLRDGGYYNNWKFEHNLVRNYLRAMDACSVDYIELGFRFKSPDDGVGPFGETSEDFLQTLDLPSTLKYAVMINGKEFLQENKEEIISSIRNVFVDASKSPISLVRVAIN